MPEGDHSRRRSRRSRSTKKKKPSKRLTNFLYKFGWFLLAAVIGIPLLAGVLYGLNML